MKTYLGEETGAAGDNVQIQHLYTEDGSVNPDLWSRKIIIWGAGNDGMKLCSKLKEAQKSVSFFCDSNEALCEKGVLGIPVLSYRELAQYEGYHLALAFHSYPEVLDKIPRAMRGNVFADYLFEHKGTGTCIMCGSHELTYDRAHFAPFLKERVFLGQEKETRLMHCLHCGTYYSEYRPDATEMERLYNKYRDEAYDAQRRKYEPNYSSEKFYERAVMERRQRGVEQFIMPYVHGKVQAKRLLDFGGDKGQFIPESFLDMERYVYDISSNETISGVTLLRTMEEAKKMEWGVILCMMLLEHVSDPMETMRQLVELMRRSTLLYVEIPCQTYMKQYSDVEINEHINFFTESSMTVAAEKLGLKVMRMETEDGKTIRVLYQKQ